LEIYNSDEQQAEAIKEWWKENGMAIIVGTVIGLVGMFGWRYFNEYREHQMEAGAVAYAAISDELSSNKEKAFADVATFVKAHSGDSYGDLAALQLAAAAVKAGKLDLAAEQLQQVADKGNSDTVKPIAAVRLARVLIEQGKFAEATQRLDAITAPAYKAMVAELRGDLFIKQGDKTKAMAAYQQALAAGGDQTSPDLNMKLDDLAIPKTPVTEEKPHA
jgi:predicted negative regulator of RcsB-dependent stress response